MTTADRRLVIVGAGLAGIRACESARRSGFRGAITMVGDEVHLPYDRPPLSKEVLLADSRPVPPLLRSADVLVDELGVELRMGTAALALDDDDRVLQTSGGDVEYDQLIIACGAKARTLAGTNRIAGVHALHTFEDSQVVWSALSKPGCRVVVVGAGFVGAEVASAARARGLAVTVVEAAAAPLTRSLGVDGGAQCMALHTDNGTDVLLSATVAEFCTARTQSGTEYVTGVRLDDGSTIPADLVVVGVGAVPATDWLSGSSVRRNDDGALDCDAALRVLDQQERHIPGVWAAGDVAWWPNPLFDKRMRLEHWTSAAEQGAHAAANAVGGATTPYQTVPYFWSDWYGTRIQFVGVPDADDLLTQRRTDAKGGTVVLYRHGDVLRGVLTIGRPDLIMKYRRLVARQADWLEGVDLGAAKSSGGVSI